ncbi:GntR family transcriptional regulator [Muricoccus radiodurans]|uniref:GntR family transcriptional regulator n=1 Tax=Muricoccus radiodurans TaxID=2231721 RepID=UPI003CF73F7F
MGLPSHHAAEAAPDLRLPLHARLRDALAARIASQEWPADSRIPAEALLAAEYGVAPNTLRRALGQLVQEGLLERRQGRGTFVRRPAFQAPLFRFFNFEDQAGSGRIIPESRIVGSALTTLPDDAARALRLPAGHAALRLDRLRFWGGEPVVMEEIFLPLPRFAALRDRPIESFETLLYPLYEREFGLVVGGVEDALRVGLADARRAEWLGVAEGSAVAIIDRLSLTVDGAPIEWRRAWGRGDRFSYRISLR